MPHSTGLGECASSFRRVTQIARSWNWCQPELVPADFCWNWCQPISAELVPADFGIGARNCSELVPELVPADFQVWTGDDAVGRPGLVSWPDGSRK
jgi:hypothetical protein